MPKRRCRSGALVCLVLAAGAASAPGQARKAGPRSAKAKPVAVPSLQEQVDRITREAILIDTHDDITSKTVTGYDIAAPNAGGQTDLPRMKGYLGAEFFAVYVDASYVRDNHSARRALEMIDTVKTDVVARYPKEFVAATTADDIEHAHAQGRIAALMGIEGGHAIEDSLRLLRDYFGLGVRYMTLTHFNTNDWADSQGDTANPMVTHHSGLTNFGKDVVREMNRLGMMVDISHTADKTFWDALEVSTAPLIASHSGARAVSSYTRNMTDDMIKAMAAKGGTVQINFGCDFLSQRYYDASQPIMAELRPKMQDAMKLSDPANREKALTVLQAEMASRLPPATMSDVVAQIDHVAKLVGVDHVGIGTDFDGVGCVPPDLNSYDKFPALTRVLLQKGYTAEDIKKIYGGNLLRVMRAVEAEARRLKTEVPIETVYAPTN